MSPWCKDLTSAELELAPVVARAEVFGSCGPARLTWPLKLSKNPFFVCRVVE